MAYVSQELKAKLAPKIKEVLKKYKIKGSISVRNHLALVVTIKESSIDFIGNYNAKRLTNPDALRYGSPATTYIQVNPYHPSVQFSEIALEAIEKIIAAMNEGNWDKSELQYDYHDVGWYTDINIGRWDKPYIKS